jgi:hypothetical protein
MAKPKRGSKASPRADSVLPNHPRTNPQERLLGRFYEPLVLLYTLGPTRGDHVRTAVPLRDNIPHLPLLDLRRMFLSDLAYICDYNKGGETVTVIGLQSTPQKHIFWVASNVGSKTKTIKFLRSLLTQIVHILATPDTANHAAELASQCVAFATPRIRKYLSHLKPLLQRSISYLTETKQAVSKFSPKILIVLADTRDFPQNPDSSNGCRVGSMRAVLQTCAAPHMQVGNQISCVSLLNSAQSRLTEATETEYIWLSA